MATTLLYIPSTEIMGFVSDNPIDWRNEHKLTAKRGGYGDQAGPTPTPAVEEFLKMLQDRRALFTQQEYAVWCFRAWFDWIGPKHRLQKLGVHTKLYRNFYPSMIDSLHVWAMLVESGRFDACVLDSADDAIGKTDLTVTAGDATFRLALIGPTAQAATDRAYKIERRSTDRSACIEIAMQIGAPKSPGNKRWHKAPDVLAAIQQGGLLPPARRSIPPATGAGQLALFCTTQRAHDYTRN